MRNRLTLGVLLASALACSPPPPPSGGTAASPAPATASSAPADVHARAIVVDTHVDTTQRMLFEKGFDLGQRHENGNVDIPRMRDGGLDAAFFSIWFPGTVTGPAAIKRALHAIDPALAISHIRPLDQVLDEEVASRRVGTTLLVGFAAFAGGVALIIGRAADESDAVKRMPWGAILMVCGVSVLIDVLEKTGGMALFTAVLAQLATPQSINGMIALVTGAISTWSSTSGVVLPTFLPTVPSLVARVGGGDPLAVALSINVGSSLVDVSPLSTIGALCVAAVADPTAARTLFRQMLIWGLSMIVVGAALCQLFAGMLAGV